MRPPICEVCGRKASETVCFSDYSPLPPGAPPGHPDGLGWFCERHLRAARALEAKPLRVTVDLLRRRQRPFRLAFGLLIAGSAVVAIRGHDPGAPRELAYLFKPLTTLLILALAARPRPLTYPGYRNPILLGLAFALVGDVFLMIPADWFLAGLASFAGTHVCYLVAFRSDARLPARRLPFVLLGGITAGVVAVLWPGLGPALKLPVVLYAVLLAAMVAQATGRALELGRRSAWVAAAGALLFLFSDVALALDRFRFPFEAQRAVVLSSYWAGQWLIAMSVGLLHSEGATRR